MEEIEQFIAAWRFTLKCACGASCRISAANVLRAPVAGHADSEEGGAYSARCLHCGAARAIAAGDLPQAVRDDAYVRWKCAPTN